MLNCQEMKNGDIYKCEDCGMEIQVIKQCKDFGTSTDKCTCATSESHCTLSCCGKDLIKKP